MYHGAAKYGVDNWRVISTDDHVNHMLMHTFAWGAGDTQDDHPGHAVCRALMALETYLVSQETHEQENRGKLGFNHK
jgi:hypothetical protein